MLDTIRTAGIGSGGLIIQFIEMVPDLVKVGVGLATIVYLAVKIKKEMGW